MKQGMNKMYVADKSKYFVLTQKGKEECAGYKNKEVGKPLYADDETRASAYAVENGWVEEVDDPDWVVKNGFKVVYNYNGKWLCAGNPVIFPEREIAEKYKRHYESFPWVHEKLYVMDEIYEGKKVKECRQFKGKKVYNTSWYYGTASLEVGDLVEEDIVEDLMNCLPPACYRKDCAQCGEPVSTKRDEYGKIRHTYSTFKKVAENTWEYCGNCFRGENKQYPEMEIA